MCSRWLIDGSEEIVVRASGSLSGMSLNPGQKPVFVAKGCVIEPGLNGGAAIQALQEVYKFHRCVTSFYTIPLFTLLFN